MLGAFGPLSLLVRYLATKDRSYLEKTTEPGRIGVLGSHLPQVVEVMRYSKEAIDGALAGEFSHAEASRRVFGRLAICDFLPPYMGFGDPDKHAQATFTLLAGARHVTWYRRNASPAWKENCVFPLTTYARHAAGAMVGGTRESIRDAWSEIRDVLVPGNREWKYQPAAMQAHGRRWAPIPEFAGPAPDSDGDPLDEFAELTGPSTAKSG
jgi:FADH2 O2-dependent halogenase